jgi:hypothetical protein
MIEDREDSFSLTEKQEEAWRQYMHDFKRDIFPMYSEFGICMGEALIIWKLNEVRNEVLSLHD